MLIIYVCVGFRSLSVNRGMAAEGEGLPAETMQQGMAHSIWRLGVGVGVKPAGIGGCLEAVSVEGWCLECVVSCA